MAKLYALPEHLPAPEYRSGEDYRAFQRREEEHLTQLRDYFRSQGYSGATGKIYQTPVADGYACYMIIEKGRTFGLIHLPYGDGWHSRDVAFLPKKEILNRVNRFPLRTL